VNPSRPYLLRALHEWIVDNGCTPLIVVDTTCADVGVPPQYVKDGRVVLNLSPLAVRDLQIGGERVQFSGRFGSASHWVDVPMAAIEAIYARENGQGMAFGPPGHLEEAGAEFADGEPDKPSAARPAGRPNLRIVE
jgi:stringent starvation protein B